MFRGETLVVDPKDEKVGEKLNKVLQAICDELTNDHDGEVVFTPINLWFEEIKDEDNISSYS